MFFLRFFSVLIPHGMVVQDAAPAIDVDGGHLIRIDDPVKAQDIPSVLRSITVIHVHGRSICDDILGSIIKFQDYAGFFRIRVPEGYRSI